MRRAVIIASLLLATAVPLAGCATPARNMRFQDGTFRSQSPTLPQAVGESAGGPTETGSRQFTPYAGGEAHATPAFVQ